MSAGNCGICATNRHTVVNAFLAADRTFAFIEREMKTMNQPTKAETVKRHLENCLNGQRENTALLESALGAPSAKISPDADFAKAVRREANRLLAEGKLQISTAHGLQAQQIIDRRAEKRADRALLTEIASLLAGGASGPPADLIEGEWKDVTPEPKALEVASE